MNNSNFIVSSIDEPAGVAEVRARNERGRRNLTWLEGHWADFLPQARGRFVAVAGEDGYVADSAEEAWAWAKKTHPEDDGAIVQFVRSDEGPRIYANRRHLAHVR